MDKYSCFVLGNVPKTDVVESFKSEEELLQKFYQKYLEINPTIITGWNTDFFDIPYLYNRTQRVLGKQIANTLSPIGQVSWIESKSRYKIAGVSSLDYLGLYRLFNYSEKSSYRLDVIGTDEVGIGKIEYEGTLQDLYENDINKYVEYNLNDVVIVKALDDKLKFIDLARSIAHKGHVPYEDVYYSSRFLEGAILVYLKKIGIVAPNKIRANRDLMDGKDKFAGAYVQDPQKGKHEWAKLKVAVATDARFHHRHKHKLIGGACLTIIVVVTIILLLIVNFSISFEIVLSALRTICMPLKPLRHAIFVK